MLNFKFGILFSSIGLIASNVFAALGLITENPPEFFLFAGRFHPLFVHLPIGFLLIAFIMEVCSRFKRFEYLKPSISFVLLLGIISGIAAVGSGYLLSLGGGYDDQTLFFHQWLGISVVILAFGALILKEKFTHLQVNKAYLPIFSISVFLLMITGHMGGNLTHGSDYLIQYMPDPLRYLAGIDPKEIKQKKIITDINEAVVFSDIVQPILEAKCLSCHNSNKLKGDLRLDHPDWIQKGGENGAILFPSDPEKSSLYQLVTLPSHDEKRMPPKGKKALTDDEIALIHWWISTGASFDEKVANLEVINNIQPKLNRLVKPEEDHLLTKTVPQADPADIKRLADQKVLLIPLGENVNFLSADFINVGDSLNREVFESLLSLKEQIAWIDFRNKQSLNNDMMSFLKEFKGLNRLNLANTGISDEGLKSLINLMDLKELNLYGTNITDEGLQFLLDIKNLKKVFLWQTNITAEEVSSFQENRPDVDLIIGMQRGKDQFANNLNE